MFDGGEFERGEKLMEQVVVIWVPLDGANILDPLEFLPLIGHMFDHVFVVYIARWVSVDTSN